MSCSVKYAQEIGATAIGLDILTDLLSRRSILLFIEIVI